MPNEWYINGQLVPNANVVRRHPGYVPFESFSPMGNPGFTGHSAYPYVGQMGGGYLTAAQWGSIRPDGAVADQNFQYPWGQGRWQPWGVGGLPYGWAAWR